MGLIFVIIAIFMVSVIALASVWWGGGILTTKSVDAEASRAISSLSQIRSAVALASAERNGELPTNLDQIIPRYLRSLPAGWTVGNDSLTGYIIFQAPQLSPKVCVAVNDRIGVPNNGDLPPSCSEVDPESAPFLGCCSS